MFPKKSIDFINIAIDLICLINTFYYITFAVLLVMNSINQ